MQPIAAELSDSDMRQLAERYAAAEDVPRPTPAAGIDAEALRRGRDIVQVGIPGQGVPACSTCHGALGRGIDKHPAYPALAGQFAAYLEMQLALWRHGKRGGGPLRGNHADGGASLEPAQAKDVALYLASIRPERGATNESCEDARLAPVIRE